MRQKQVQLTLTLPVNSWQWLAAMAAEDTRKPADFLHWLTNQEAKRRGLITSQSPKPEAANEAADARA